MALDSLTPQLFESSTGLGLDLDEIGASNRQRILVVENEADTAFLLKQILRLAGFNVSSASSGREALKKIVAHEPNLVLLDLMMPEMDGWETLRLIRQMTEVPVVILSVLGSKEEIVEGLQLGADDYITKPFYNAEVVERVRAILRRAERPQVVCRMVFPRVELTVDIIQKEVIFRNNRLHLTPKEFEILSVLAKHAPEIVSYATITKTVWGSDSANTRRRMKYLIYTLRHKFDEVAPGADLIRNVGRSGYKLQTLD